MRKDMTWKQRLEYFKDYYLFQVVCIIIGTGVCLLLAWHFFVKDNTVSVYVAVVNESLDLEKANSLREELGQLLEVDEEEILIDDRFDLEGDGLNKLEIYLKSNQIDVLIADRKEYEWLCGFGFMREVSKQFGADILEQYGDQLVYAAGYLESEEISFEDHETGQGEVLAYGFQVEETSRYGDFINLLQDPVIGIAEGCGREEDAVKCILWMLEER